MQKFELVKILNRESYFCQIIMSDIPNTYNTIVYLIEYIHIHILHIYIYIYLYNTIFTYIFLYIFHWELLLFIIK